jgi:hypothetical protein
MWGQFRSIGHRAWDRHKRIHVRVIAYRRIRCTDGEVWYSKANVLDISNGNGWAVDLPTCDDPSIVG